MLGRCPYPPTVGTSCITRARRAPTVHLVVLLVQLYQVDARPAIARRVMQRQGPPPKRRPLTTVAKPA